jgi:FkbM family methyltransferase
VQKLRQQLQREIDSGRAVCNAFGLSDLTETRDLYKDQEITGMASLNARDLGHLHMSASMVEQVPLKRGDDYIREQGISRVHLLKIDVEGWEMSVLNGLKGAFERKIIDRCQFEFGHAHIERRENFRDFYRFFSGLGYKLGALKPNGKVDVMGGYEEIAEHYYATNYVALA